MSNLKVSKAEIYLTVVLTLVFVILSITKSRSLIDNRDVVWLGVSIIGAGLYAFSVVKQGQTSLLLPLGKSELILLVSQLLGFVVWVIKSKAVQKRDIVAWLFFYPYLLWVGVLVLCVFPLCFWLFKYLSNRG